MISFENLEFPESVQLHYVYAGERQMGVLMTPSSLPRERIEGELARHGLTLRDGNIPLIRRVGEVAYPFINILRDEIDATLGSIENVSL